MRTFETPYKNIGNLRKKFNNKNRITKSCPNPNWYFLKIKT